jgi:hypothetical protein
MAASRRPIQQKRRRSIERKHIMIPITDHISGRPAGTSPVIQTLGKRQQRKALRPKYVLVIPAGDPAPDGAVLFCAGHRMSADGIYGRGWNQVDVYRGQANRLALLPGCIPAGDVAALPVTDEEIDQLLVYLRANAAGIDYTSAEVTSRTRQHRGDLSELPWLLTSPWTLSQAQAEEAGIAGLGTDHLYAGVREEHGRWQYYRGLGSHLIIEGTADTREEAEIMARAHLFSAWLRRIEELLAARGGDLSWGWPLPSPHWQSIGDPQQNY